MSTDPLEPALNARSYTPHLTSLRQVQLVTGLAFVFTLFIGLIVIGLAERSRVLEAKAAASNTASGYVTTLQERLARSLSSTYALAAVLTQGGGTIENFEQLGRQMLTVYGGISSLQLAENGIISAIVPHAGNEKAYGHNLLEDTSRNKEARLAVSSGKLTLAGPFELVQGGTAVVGRLPVFLPGADAKTHFWGFTTALIRIPDLLQSSKLGNLSEQGYRYQLWRIHPDRNDRQVIKSTDELPFTDPVETVFDVPNGKWTLSVEPVNGWHSPLRIAAQLAAAGMVAALFSLLTNILLTQPLRLRHEVAARTRELLEANQILGAEIITREKAEAALRLSRFSLEQASDALYWINRTGQIIDVNTAACRILGYSREELLQLRVPDINIDYDAATWSAHWAELQQEGALTFESTNAKRTAASFLSRSSPIMFALPARSSIVPSSATSPSARGTNSICASLPLLSNHRKAWS
jgi:sensor domain CHASE-containing protein